MHSILQSLAHSLLLHTEHLRSPVLHTASAYRLFITDFTQVLGFSYSCVSWFVGNTDRCLWSWAYLVFVARPRVSTDVVDSARFLCVAAAGAPSALVLLVAASPLLPPALAASVLPALGSCCSAPAPAAGSTPRVFDLSLRPPPTVLALVVSALSPAWGVVALAMLCDVGNRGARVEPH